MDSKKRLTGLDYLRVLCVVMIILGHMITQTDIKNTNNIYCQILNFGFGKWHRLAINCFVMISAWFLVDKKYNNYRVFSVWWKTFIYSLTVTSIVYLLGFVPFSITYMVQSALPIMGRPEWYMCEYILLLLLSPFLNKALNEWETRTTKSLLVIMGCGMVAISTLFPIQYTPPFFSELMWFIFLYLLIGYLKRRGYSISRKKCASAIILGYLLLAFPTPFSDYYMNHYEALPCFMVSFGLFYLFKDLQLRENVLVREIAGASGAIYILHQVPVFWRYMGQWSLWDGVFNLSAKTGEAGIILYVICVLIVIIVFGTLIDQIQTKVIEKPLLASAFVGKIDEKLTRIIGI